MGMNKSFSEILQYYLKSEQLTQAQFALKINARQSQISEWLKGKAKPGYDMIRQMSIAFAVPADYWLGIIENY